MSISMDKDKFEKIKKNFEAHGGVIVSSDDIDRHLESTGTEASAMNENTILIRPNKIPSASAMFEELIHTAQYKAGRATGNNDIDMEIEAKIKLIKYQKQYEIPDFENDISKKQIIELLKMKEGV